MRRPTSGWRRHWQNSDAKCEGTLRLGIGFGNKRRRVEAQNLRKGNWALPSIYGPAGSNFIITYPRQMKTSFDTPARSFYGEPEL
jgi:hypothetical protein